MNREFDRLLEAIRRESAEPGKAAERVRVKLEAEVADSAAVARLESCADFRALFPAYRTGAVSEARRMLLEDHLHSCVACRKAFSGRAAVVPMPARRPRVLGWAVAAAAAAIAIVLVTPWTINHVLPLSGPRGTVASIDGELYAVMSQRATPLAVGASIGENEEIRTAKGSRAVVRLRDGSMVEMAERSDLTLSERWSGKTIHLAHGAVMVEAAKQRRGRLEVATPDCLVSVKGTIFEVRRGIKGSRVSVVEGEVKVDQDGASSLLHRGDQKATNDSMARTSVAEDVSWSQNSTKYLALLGELAAIQRRIEEIPGPGLRYESKLAGLLPPDTMIYAAIPNLGPTLTEATAIFDERLEQSAVLREWWKEKESKQLQAVVNQVKAVSDYLGDEIVLAVPAGAEEPMLIAEARRPGLESYLRQQFGAVKGPPQAMTRGNFVALGTPASLARFAAAVDRGQGGFLTTPLWKRIAQSYRTGAGWIFAADMEQIAGRNVPKSDMTATAGLDNVRYLVIERKPNLGRTENSATLDFEGDRHGVASWLAAPGPMGTLDFISPEASFAGSFVIKNPGTLLRDLLSSAAPALAEIQQQTGVDVLNDVAANLGGEMTVAVDGPLLPTPSWKIAVEVNNPARIEWAIEQAAHQQQLQIENREVNGLTYYSVTSPKIPYEVHYVFTDGYLLLGPTDAVLTSAIQTRSSGATLSRSSAFRAQLPQDGHVNFSALLYYNMGAQVGPAVDQLKALMTPEQQKSAAMLVENRAPGLIYAYGAPGRIMVASRGGFFGLGLDSLVGLNAKGPGGLTGLFPAAILHGLRN